MKTKILYIEDEPYLGKIVKETLEIQGYQVVWETDGSRVIQHLGNFEPDVCVLDIMLPKINGYEVCKTLKKKKPELPIIMLTAKSQESEIVTGLELGADDYITKPFGVMELLARINAVFRRTKTAGRKDETIFFGDFEINIKRQMASRAGRPIMLTAREFEIMDYFISRQGEIVTRGDLLSNIWGYESIPDTRTVDAHIGKLRKKIEDNPEDPRLIITLHGLGYKLT